MRDKTSSSGILFAIFGFLIILSLKDNEFQQHIIVVEQKLLKSWTVFLGFFENRLKNFVNFVV